MCTALLTCLVALAAAIVFATLTHGFTVFTAEGERRASIAAHPAQVPTVQGTDQNGQRRRLFMQNDETGRPSRITIVDFIYTRCETVCRALGDSGQQLQQAIISRGLADRIQLVSVSFDPQHDTEDALARYAKRVHANPRVWTHLSPGEQEDLPRLLAAFGIVVIAAPMSQFQHNAAFHVLDGQGRLARIVDPDDPMRALEEALTLVQAGDGR